MVRISLATAHAQGGLLPDREKSRRPSPGSLSPEVLDHLSEGCQVVGFDWRYLYLNAAAERHGRLPRAALLGKTMPEVYPGIEDTPLFEALRRCRDSRTVELIENEFTFPDGTTGWFELRIEPVPEGVFVLSLDIDERKRAEARIRHLNAVLAGIRGVNQLIVRESDPQLLIERACALLVASRGFDTCSILIPDHRGKRLLADAGEEGKLRALRTMLTAGILPTCVAHTLQHGGLYLRENPARSCPTCPVSGEHGADRDTLAVELASDGRSHGVLVVSLPHRTAADLDEQGLLQEIAGDLAFALRGMELAAERAVLGLELRRSEERFRELFGRLGSGVVLFEPVDGGQDFVFRDLNSAAEAIGRVERGAVLGRRLTELFPAIAEAGLLAVVREAFATGAPVRHQATRYQDSRISRWLDLFAFKLSSGELVAIVDDLTEHRKTEEQLRQAQKMEAVGRLAGGVAHDFNNMLSVVLCHASFLLADLAPGDPLREDAEQVRLAGERAAGLTRQLLALSRQQLLQPQPLDLNEVVATLEKLLRRVIGEEVVLRIVLAPEPVRVHADRGQLEQVVMNLAINARDAMPGGGTLLVETSRPGAGEPPGGRVGQVLLSVSDTGHGMDAETQARIFEPFFTTKPPGQGTGLGLSTVQGIVQQSGGGISLRSAPGQGTTFQIFLPELELERAGSPDPVQKPLAPPASGGKETILVVEDEEPVRRAATEILRRHGYELLEAASAAEALELAASHPGVIHLLLTDVVMPVSSGRDLAECLGLYRPGTPILFMSGHTDSSILRQQVLAEGADFLQKPLTPDRLARKVREVLDRRRGS